MNLLSSLLPGAVILSTLGLTSCTNGVFSSPLYLEVQITPRPASLPLNGTVILTGAATNNLGLPVWTIFDGTYSSNAGTLTAIAGAASSILYTAPSTPPIYSAGATGVTQGTVTIQASVTAPSQSTLPTAHDAVTVFIIAPTVTAGISPTSATVARGAVQLFSGYAVGSVNNAVTYQVNGVTGGSVTFGTITPTGYYVAPAAIPVSGNQITVTVTSVADPTRTASAAVTLQ